MVNRHVGKCKPKTQITCRDFPDQKQILVEPGIIVLAIMIIHGFKISRIVRVVLIKK